MGRRGAGVEVAGDGHVLGLLDLNRYDAEWIRIKRASDDRYSYTTVRELTDSHDQPIPPWCCGIREASQPQKHTARLKLPIVDPVFWCGFEESNPLPASGAL